MKENPITFCRVQWYEKDDPFEVQNESKKRTSSSYDVIIYYQILAQ